MGYIYLDRKIEENELFKEKPFDELHAWIWLLLKANYKDKKRRLREGIVEIKRGQLVAGYRYLADEWGWSKGKVSRFLDMIEADGMISKNGTQNGTVITIENYAKYQDQRDSERDTDGTLAGHSRDTRGDTKKKVKKDKEHQEGREGARARGAFGLLSLSDEDVSAFLSKFPEDGQRYIDELDAYMAQTGKTYQNNLAALYRWAKNDKSFGKKQETKTGLELALEREGITL